MLCKTKMKKCQAKLAKLYLKLRQKYVMTTCRVGGFLSFSFVETKLIVYVTQRQDLVNVSLCTF